MARVHLDQLVLLDPGRGSLRRERAQVLMELGDAAGAAADSAAAAELADE